MATTDELADEVKKFIVARLACYDTPSEVAKAVKEDFGLEVSRQRVEAYDPNKVAGKGLSQEWRDLFGKTRELYLADTADIGIAQPTFRLRMLEKMFAKAYGMGNIGKAAELLEQAAKETGGAYTNLRKLAGGDGGPIKHEDVTPHELKKKALDELGDIFGAAAVAAATAAASVTLEPPFAPDGAPAEHAAGGDPLVRSGDGSGGTAQPGAPEAGEEMAGEE